MFISEEMEIEEIHWMGKGEEKRRRKRDVVTDTDRYMER